MMAGRSDRKQSLSEDCRLGVHSCACGLGLDRWLGTSTATTSALQRETRTIPIVFVGVSDPVTSGIVPRLNQPGGNITGFASFEPTLGGKWLELPPGCKAQFSADFHSALQLINEKSGVGMSCLFMYLGGATRRERGADPKLTYVVAECAITE
jgi:hypothetical protein